MAITIGNTSSKQHENTVTASTLSHTINSGINRLLVVGITEMNKGASQAVTYNGTAMTKLVDQVSQFSADMNLTLWYMLNVQLPAGGAYNISYTNGANRAYGQMFAICLSNVFQSAPFASGGDNTANGNTARSIALNNLRNGDAIVFMSMINRGATNTWTPAANYAEVFDMGNDGTPPASSTLIRRIVTASGNYTPSSTSTLNGFVVSAALAVHPAEEVLGGPIFY